MCCPGTFGSARRNDYTGPKLSQLDLTLSKDLPLNESHHLEFHADAYNVLNKPNYANPGTVRLPQTSPLPRAPAHNPERLLA